MICSLQINRVQKKIITIIKGDSIMAKNTENDKQNGIKVDDPLAKEKEEIALEKLRAEARALKAKADKAAADADKGRYEAIKEKWNISETEGLKGTITVSKGAGYTAELLAYKAIDSIAEIISKEISPKVKDGELIILGQEDFSAQAALWKVIELKLDTAISQIVNCIKIFKPEEDSKGYTKATLPGKKVEIDEVLKAAPAILGAAADIAAFFKTNYTISSRKISINEIALKAAVGHNIIKPKNEGVGLNEELTILFPELCISAQGKLYRKFAELNSHVAELIKIRFEIFSTPENDIKQQPGSTNSIKQEIIKQIDAEIGAAIILVSTLTTKADDSLSPLESVATVDFAMLHKAAKILHLAIVSQEGEFVISESTFFQGRISYLGGAVVSYFLMNDKGACLCSGTVQKTDKANYKSKKGILTEN
jgi:hypothetical protein